MLRPDVLLTGETAISTRRQAGSDDLLATQLAKLDRKIDSVAAERRRLADLYQASFIEREDLLRRGTELALRVNALNAQRQTLNDQRAQLAQQDTLRNRVEEFAQRVRTTIDQLDFDQRQNLLRLVVEEVRVTGWQVEIRFRIPLDSPPEPPNTTPSSKDRLRSLHGNEWRKLQKPMRSPTSGQGEKARIALAFRCQVAPQIALIVAYTTHAGNYPHLGQRQSATIILIVATIAR